MARARNASLDQLVQDAITPVLDRISSAIEKHVAKLVAKLVAQALSRELAQRTAHRGATRAGRRARARTAEMTRWVADKRARRVPNFVIEMTGLDTKKRIVARFGESAAFEKGKPLPPESRSGEPKTAKAKPPTIRKGGKGAAWAAAAPSSLLGPEAPPGGPEGAAPGRARGAVLADPAPAPA